MSTFYRLCPPDAYRLSGRRNDQDGICQLNNGSEVLFLHLDDPSTEGIIKGLDLNWFVIDQAEEKPEEMEEFFDLLMGRLGRWEVAEVPEEYLAAWEARTGRPWKFRYPMSGKPAPPPFAIIACNPDTEMHWIYRRFHPESPEYRAKSQAQFDLTGHPTGTYASYEDLGYKMFDMDSLENVFLADANKQFLLAHDDAFIRRNVRGIWGLPEGAIHAVDPLSLIPGTPALLDYFRSACTLHRTLDHGDSAPTVCGWWAVDRNANAFAIREYYLPNALVSTHRANITALSAGERYDFNLADPSIFHKLHQKHGGRWSTADEYSDCLEQDRATALFWSPAENNELGTRNRINEYLRVDPQRVHPITGAKGSPRLFFVTPTPEYPQGIVHILRELRAQRRVKVGTDLGKAVYSDERNPDIADHGYDVARYFLASRPPVAQLPVPHAGPGTFFGEMQRLTRAFRKQMGRRR
jgi:hypothetical protein